MKLLRTVGVILTIAFTGCAHSMMRGSVVMKASDNEAHVCMGEQDVKAGDKIALFKNVCSKTAAGNKSNGACEKVKLGEGEITKTINDHYSILKVNTGVQFEEGNTVEKL